MMPPPPPPMPMPPPPPHDPHVMEANGRYYHSKPPESPVVILTLNVVNTVTQLLLGAVVFSAFCFAILFYESSPFTQHIYLCVIGYVILMSQAILTFNTHSGWAYGLMYPQKRTIHWIMQVVGAAFAIAGSAIKMNDNSANFQTAHGITGFVAMLLTILSLIGGLMNIVFPAQMSAIIFKLIHICLGMLTITVAYISLCLGFNDVYRYVFGDVNADLSISITIFALSGIIISSFFNIVKRLNE